MGQIKCLCCTHEQDFPALLKKDVIIIVWGDVCVAATANSNYDSAGC